MQRRQYRVQILFGSNKAIADTGKKSHWDRSYFDGEGFSGEGYSFEITHWHYLPEPPKN